MGNFVNLKNTLTITYVLQYFACSTHPVPKSYEVCFCYKVCSPPREVYGDGTEQ